MERKWLGLKPYILIELNVSKEEPTDPDDPGFTVNVQYGGNIDTDDQALTITEMAVESMRQAGWAGEEDGEQSDS